MKITIATLGTRGDVQPYVALGLGLKKAGHQVKIAVDKGFENFVRENGLDFAPINADPKAALSEVKLGMQKNPLKYFNRVKQQYEKVINDAFPQTIKACKDADLILFSSLSISAGHVAEALNIPAIGAFLQSSSPSKYLTSIMAKPLPNWMPFQGMYNYWSIQFESRIFLRMLYKTINKARQEYLNISGLPWRTYARFNTSKAPIVYGYSPSVIPFPPDWGDHLHVDGYWFLDQGKDWQPPKELSSFLSGGDKPIYFGFGSMVDDEAGDLTKIIVEAVNRVGKRAILLGGWSKLSNENLPDTLLKIDNVPHDWLFPQMAAVVHHGGAGTTAAGFRAGVPTMVVPFMADQPFWGRKVAELGVGPAPISRDKLTVEKLVMKLEQLLNNEETIRNSATLGKKIRAEDGVGQTVKVIEKLMQDPQAIIDIYQEGRG